jgi:arginyl-tRNA--protein-N-Asp/Glu arginylyltransferase
VIDVPFINEFFHAPEVSAAQMDEFWSQGWRHFGVEFFRYSAMPTSTGAWHVIQPLRVEVHGFIPTKSQRRVLRRNADLRCEWSPAVISPEVQTMFDHHKLRFTENVPESLSVFFSADPAKVPCECLSLRVWSGERLVAVSFLDIGQRATSSVYGIFEPEESARSLGVFTMLKEIEWTQSHGRLFYYPGYATREPSHYDYKKQFAGMQYLDWEEGWHVMPK